MQSQQHLWPANSIDLCLVNGEGLSALIDLHAPLIHTKSAVTVILSERT